MTEHAGSVGKGAKKQPGNVQPSRRPTRETEGFVATPRRATGDVLIVGEETVSFRESGTPLNVGGGAASLLLAVAKRLGEVPQRDTALSAAQVDDMADVMVNALVDRLAEEGTPEKDLGPFYSTESLRRRLGVTRQALAGRVDRHTLLALPTEDGNRLYPLFQFSGREGSLTVVPGLPEVLKRFSHVDASPMMAAAWLTGETAGLDKGRTAIEHLRRGGDVNQVLALLDADAARWER